MPYPTTDDPIVRPVDGDDDASVASLDGLFDAVDALMVFVGPDTATANSSGTLVEQVNYLLASPGGIFKQDSAPGSPTEDDLWLDTDDADRPLTIRVSSAWQLIGANALELDGNAIDAASPTAGQVLTWDATNSEWIADDPTGGMDNPLTTLGDLLYGGAAGAPTRLGIGSTGQLLSVVSGSPAWITAPFVTSPSSIITGGILYKTSSGYGAENPTSGSSGYVLTSQGLNQPPRWLAPTGSPPGSAVEAPASPEIGDLLYYDGSDYVGLHTSTGPAAEGDVLTLVDVAGDLLPQWATPANGFTSPLDDVNQLIYGGLAGAATKLEAPSSNEDDYVLGFDGGDLAWTNRFDYATAMFYAG